MVRHLVRDSVLYGAMNALQKLAPFFILPLVIRHLGKEGLKIYDVAFGYAFLFSWLIILGQDAAASLLFFDERKTSFAKRQVTGYAFFLQVISLLFFGGLLSAFADVWSRFLFSGAPAIARWWRTALWVLPGQIALNYALNLLLWRQRKAAYAMLCFLQMALSVTGVFLSLVCFNGHLALLFYSIIGSTSLTAVAGLFMVKEQWRIPLFPLNTALIKILLRLGLPFALTAFFQQLLPAADRFFLLHYNYGAALAPYVLASKLGSLVNFGTSAFVLAFTPYSLAKLNDDDAEEELSRLFGVVSTVAFLAVPFALLFKNVLIAVFADVSYKEAAKLLPFFFFGWVFDLFGYFTVLGIYRSHKTHLSLLLFLTGFLLLCLLNVLLVPQWGLYGAALGFCLCKMALFFLSLFWLRKHFYLRLHAASFGTAFLLAAGCSYSIYTLPPWVNVFACAVLGFAFFGYWRKKGGDVFFLFRKEDDRIG